MNYEDRLRWYRENRFTAADVTRATGLSERAQRELQKLGILQPVPQPNPKAQRLLDSTMLKRAAVVAPFNRSGFSLGVAGRIVYAAMMLEDLIFHIVDPWEVYYDAATAYDPVTGLYQLRQVPHNRDKWFDPAHPPVATEGDTFLAVVNSRFVLRGRSKPRAVYGELSSDLTDFIWWDNSIYDHLRSRIRGNQVDLSVKGISDHTHDFMFKDGDKTIAFQCKSVADADERMAEEALKNPITNLTINASLTLRIALRRLLEIDGPSEI